MTPKEYWDGDSTLVKAYRKAHALKMQQTNQQLWLQGYYVYHAIASLSPILHAFAAAGTKAEPYLDKPLAITKADIIKDREDAERAAYENGLSRFLTLASADRLKPIETEEGGDVGE